MKPFLLSFVIVFGLAGCSIRDASGDIAQCRDIAVKRVAKDANAVDATFALCAESRAAKRESREKKETAVSLAKIIADILR